MQLLTQQAEQEVAPASCGPHAPGMQGSSAAATELLLTHYRDCIRGCLSASAGYECQESAGDFMLCFGNAVSAILFCLKVRPRAAQMPCCSRSAARLES